MRTTIAVLAVFVLLAVTACMASAATSSSDAAAVTLKIEPYVSVTFDAGHSNVALDWTPNDPNTPVAPSGTAVFNVTNNTAVSLAGAWTLVTLPTGATFTDTGLDASVTAGHHTENVTISVTGLDGASAAGTTYGGTYTVTATGS